MTYMVRKLLIPRKFWGFEIFFVGARIFSMLRVMVVTQILESLIAFEDKDRPLELAGSDCKDWRIEVCVCGGHAHIRKPA